MADTKITSLLTPQVTTNPATDVLPIVNIADTSMATSGSTRKITVNQLLGAGGTATLASATISGDLTVDTSTLKVDSANNRVGIGTASPQYPLDVRGGNISAGNGTIFGGISYSTRTSIGSFSNHDLDLITNGNVQYLVTTAGNHTWYNGGTTAMTLNSTGLGVGVAPGSGKIAARAGTAATGNSLYADNIDGTYNPWIQIQHSSAGIKIFNSSSFGGSSNNLIFGNGTTSETMRIDSSGNVGIGVTPSAWNSGWSGGIIQFKNGTSVGNPQNGSGAFLGANVFRDASGNDVYISSDRATRYRQQAGQHQFFYDTGTQTAGANTSLTQAMTLDASGNLLVGTTSQNGSWNTKLTLSNDSGTTKWAVGPYLGGVTNFLISAGAAAGVYLNGTAATSWTSASDERLKDIIEPISNAIAKVGSLRAVIGKFKFDENNTRKPFLIAQDIQAVLPEAVDASNPEKLGVAYTDIIPLLVAAIKELTAEVNALKNA